MDSSSDLPDDDDRYGHESPVGALMASPERGRPRVGEANLKPLARVKVCLRRLPDPKGVPSSWPPPADVGWGVGVSVLRARHAATVSGQDVRGPPFRDRSDQRFGYKQQLQHPTRTALSWDPPANAANDGAVVARVEERRDRHRRSKGARKLFAPTGAIRTRRRHGPPAFWLRTSVARPLAPTRRACLQAENRRKTCAANDRRLGRYAGLGPVGVPGVLRVSGPIVMTMFFRDASPDKNFVISAVSSGGA